MEFKGSGLMVLGVEGFLEFKAKFSFVLEFRRVGVSDSGAVLFAEHGYAPTTPA